MFSVIFVGTRLKGISLGIMGGLGLGILAFFFHLQPTDPPFDVLLIITAVVTAASTLEAAGGLHYLTNLAEKLIRKYPHRINFIGPFVTYLFTFLAGTGHIVYSILPVIATGARETGVRPERPLSATVIAAQQAAIASPISAPTAIVIGLLAPHGIELLDMLQVLVPATLGGTVVTTLVVNNLGKELYQDPAYLQSVQASTREAPDQGAAEKYSVITNSAKLAVGLFMVGIVLIILLGIFKGLRPSWEVDGKTSLMAMPTIIEIMMLTIAALIVLLCGLEPTEITKSSVFTARYPSRHCYPGYLMARGYVCQSQPDADHGAGASSHYETSLAVQHRPFPPVYFASEPNSYYTRFDTLGAFFRYTRCHLTCCITSRKWPILYS